MKVNIYRATLTIEGKEIVLNKSVARQLPILDGEKRWRASEDGREQPEPICKVNGKTLGQTRFRWMYLVEDDEAGLGWVAPCVPSPGYAKRIIDHGGWVDTPADVRTVIL